MEEPTGPGEPRPHHYRFAHEFLPAYCHHRPLLFFEIMGSPERDPFLAHTWRWVEKDVGEAVTDFDVGETSARVGLLMGSPAVVIRMPAPVASPEALLICVVLVDIPVEEGPPIEAKVRYFTLEYGVVFGAVIDGVVVDRSVDYYLCEWNDGSHLNHGTGTPPTEEAFLLAVSALL